MANRPARGRLAARERCGTVLDHTRDPDGQLNVIPIQSLNAYNRYTSQGNLDKRQRVYQNGGEAKNFIYRRLGGISIPLDVWRAIRNQADYLEMVDHDTNSFYRIPTATAADYAQTYEAPGLGQRVSIDLAAWQHLDADWNPWRPPKPITEDPPMAEPAPIVIQDALF